jgi:hypothetical protein
MSFLVASDKGQYTCPTLTNNGMYSYTHCMLNPDGSYLKVSVSKYIVYFYESDCYKLWSYDSKGYNWVCKLPKFKIESEEQLLNKIKLMLLLS